MKYIITEQQLNDIPEEEPSNGKTVRRLVQDIGLTEVSEIMGGIDRVIELPVGIKIVEHPATDCRASLIVVCHVKV